MTTVIDTNNKQKDCGVYTITNIINNKKYVGSSTYLTSRKSAHFSKLRRWCHPNMLLQNTVNKYGLDCLKFETIILSEESYAREMEQNLINTGNYVYNISKEVGKINKNFVSVLQYDIYGNFIAEYPSIREAADLTQGNEIAICENCRGNINTSNSSVWKYKTENFERKLELNLDPSIIKSVEKSLWKKTNPIIFEWDCDSNLLGEHGDYSKLCENIPISEIFLYNHLLQGQIKTNTIKNKVYTLDATRPKIVTNNGIWILQLDIEGNILNRCRLKKSELAHLGYKWEPIHKALNLGNGSNKIYDGYWKYDDGSLFTPIEPIENKGSRKVVEKLDLEGNVLETYKSALEAYNKNGVKRNKVKIDITKIYNGTFMLRYADDQT